MKIATPIAVLAIVLAAGCGSASPASSGKGGKPAASLTISVTAARGGAPRKWTLTCDPAGGTHPDAAAACRALEHLKDPFAPVPQGIMCPMIVSGPQTATITGTWHGRPVAASFNRQNGCESARWAKIQQVLGGVNPGGPMLPASNSGGSG